MKVAIIHSIYKPYTRGGAEVVVENIVHGLQQAGHEVLVISIGYKNEQEIIDGVKIYRIKPFNLFNFLDINNKPTWLRLPWHLIDMVSDWQAWLIYRVLKKEKPDFIMTHNLKGLGYYIPWVIKIMKIKLIHTIHDMQLIHPSGLLIDGQKIYFPVVVYTWLCKKLFSSIKTVIYPSQYIKSIYDQYGFFLQAEKVVIGNPINIVVDNRYEDKSCRTAGLLNILFLGQVEDYKGINDLIEALEKVKINFILHVVGNGSSLEKVKKKVTGDQRFKFYGHLTQTDLAVKIWPLVDLLVNPTRVPESFGMVVAEAMIQRVPILATKIGAIPELIEEGRTGWLFAVGNVAELSQKIEYISQNICGLGAVKLLAYEEVQKFKMENYLKKILILLK